MHLSNLCTSLKKSVVVEIVILHSQPIMDSHFILLIISEQPIWDKHINMLWNYVKKQWYFSAISELPAEPYWMNIPHRHGLKLPLSVAPPFSLYFHYSSFANSQYKKQVTTNTGYLSLSIQLCLITFRLLCLSIFYACPTNTALRKRSNSLQGSCKERGPWRGWVFLPVHYSLNVHVELQKIAPSYITTHFQCNMPIWLQERTKFRQ